MAIKKLNLKYYNLHILITLCFAQVNLAQSKSIQKDSGKASAKVAGKNNTILLEIVTDSSTYIWPFGDYNIPWIMDDSSAMQSVAGMEEYYAPKSIKLTNVSPDTLYFQRPEETDQVCPVKLEVIKDNADTVVYYYTFLRINQDSDGKYHEVPMKGNPPSCNKAIYVLPPGESAILVRNVNTTCNYHHYDSRKKNENLLEPVHKKITAKRNFVTGKMIATFTRPNYSCIKSCWSGTVQSKAINVIFISETKPIQKDSLIGIQVELVKKLACRTILQ